MASPCGRPTATAASRSTASVKKRCLPIPLILERLRAVRHRLDCCVVRDDRYITFEFIFDGSDARNAARERKPFVRQNVTFPQIPLPWPAA
eukprot:1931391-Prymnesium_polylepis.1